MTMRGLESKHRMQPLPLAVLFLAITCVIGPAAAGVPATAETDNPFTSLLGNGEHGSLTLLDPVISGKAGSNQSYTIRYTRWKPEQPNGRVIVYNHGFQSHRAWFNGTANRLAGAGYVVYAFDRIGSGTSGRGLAVEKGEVVETRGHCRSWELYLETLDLMVELAGEENPDSAIFIWGNSYGAKIVTTYLFSRADRLKAAGVAGAIFTAPGLFQNKKSMPLPFSKVKLLFSGSLKKFPVPMVERDGDNGASWFVAPGPWFERIRDDNLSIREVTRTFYLQTRELDGYIKKRPRSARLPLPTIYLMVENDILMDNVKMKQHIETRGSDAVYKFFPGGPENKHFILFTEDADEALGDIQLFLEGRADEIEGARRVRKILE